MHYTYFSNSETPPVDAKKLRVIGGRKIEYKGETYRVKGIDNSPRAAKKYVANVQNLTTGTSRKVHWGATGYDDYYVHKDKARRDRFQKRHGAILKKDGSRAADDPFSPAFYATHANWSYMNGQTINI